MIKEEEIKKIVKEYKKVRIGVLGSHSAEEVGIAAKSFGLETIVVCQKGREKLYNDYNRFLFDRVILLENFKDILKKDIQEELRKLNVIFIPNRSFSVYVGYDGIENDFMVPIYGNRFILRCEERDETKNQYWLLEQAGIKVPKRFNSPKEIDKLSIVKVQQKNKPLERAFFYPTSQKDYEIKAEELIEKGVIDKEGLNKARVEEYVLGQKFNANFQGWALQQIFGLFDFVGFDDRKQTNLSGIRDLPAVEQLKINIPIKNEEIGHYGLTMRESQKPLVYNSAKKFIRICEKEFPPGIIGLFALQGAIAEDSFTSKLEFYVFDISPRIPGCPCVGPTSPEMRRLSLKFKTKIETPMDLPMLEIKYAKENNLLSEIIT